MFTIGAAVPLPSAPYYLGAIVDGSTVMLSWTAPSEPVTGFLLEAGTAPGRTDLAMLPLGPTPAISISSVPPGRYFVRVRGINDAGVGSPSGDLVVVVP